MKKMLIAAAVMAAFAGGSAQAASNGTIYFNGELVNGTCDVDINGSGNNATVGLPTLDISALTQGNTGGDTGFTMSITGCATTINPVSSFFENGPTVNATGHLVNTTASGSNIKLQLLDNFENANGGASSTPIVVGDEIQSATTGGNYFETVSSGAATLKYGVRYYAEDADASEGLVTSSVTYALMYK